MSNLYTNLLLKNTFLLLNGAKNNFNMLNNYTIINYRGILIERIPLDHNNHINLEKIIYYPIYGNEPKERKINNNNDLTIIINNNDKSEETFKDSEEKLTKDSVNYNNNPQFSSKGEQNFKSNNFLKCNDFKSYKEENSVLFDRNIEEPIPPRNIISIIKNNEEETINILNSNKSEINYKEINDIILFNIESILNNNDKTGNNNSILFNKVVNEVNNYKYFNINSQDNTNNPDNKNVIKKLFTTNLDSSQLKLKRKRKFRKKNGDLDGNRHVHSAFDNDNILRKIQVHYLSFIVNFSNDVISSFIIDKCIPRFKNLDYKIKKTVNHQFVETLKRKTIGEILQLKVSPKMKINGEQVNKNIYQKIWEKCPFIHNFLQQNYLTVFTKYYLNSDKRFEVNGKIIKLSSRTKTIVDLIRKNSKFKEKLRYVIINYFLNNYKRIKKPKFKIQIYKQKNH